MSRIKLNRTPNYRSKFEAFTYQKKAVEEISNLDYAAIFHEQGLGKTKIAIDLMLYWFEKDELDTVILFVKKGLLKNWEKELATHSHLKPKILSQNKKQNYYIFNSPAKVILCNYEIIISEFERLKLFLNTRSVGTILDESVKIKNPSSELTKTFLKLSTLFKKRIIMSGTPIANRPYDIWSQIKFLDFGNSLGNNFNKFKREHNLSNDLFERKNKRDEFEKNLSTLFNKISSFTIRETKKSGIIELPQKVYKSIKTEWESRQYEIYNQIKNEERLIIIKHGIPTEDNSEELLKRLIRLVEVTSNPKLIDDSYQNEPGKFSYLMDVLNNVILNNEKAIIWSSFIKNVDWLYYELSEYGTVRLHGKMNIDERNKSIDSFLDDSRIKILVATPGAAKEGLTLTVSNHVIFYDRGFSLDDYLQAQDRIHRISQKKPCYIYNLVMSDSIDEWIDILLQSKDLAAKLGQGDISEEFYKSQISYNFGEIIRNILGINEI